MATCTTMTARDPHPRAPTPRPPTSSFRILTKRTSYQSLRSPVLMSPIERTFSAVDLGSQDSPGWEHINVISPSTASHHSLYSDTDDGFRSPRLALLTSNLHAEHEGRNTLISPSDPVPQPGDELLYDIATEEKPEMPFFHPEFQTAVAKTKQEMKDISLAIWGCPASHQMGSDLHSLKQRAQELSEFEPSSMRTLAFVGESGIDKRSVINALLDKPYLACTDTGSHQPPSVITEYRFRPAHHNEPFGVEIEYSTTDDVRELIEELLRSFRASHIPAFQDVHDSEERRDIRHRSEKAWHTLHSMFRNQPIFTREFILEYSDDAEVPLIRLLQQWASEFLHRRPGGARVRDWSATAFNIDECTDKLAAFTADPIDEGTPALWPFVKVVRIYLRSSILHSGLVLADCPSPRDLNFSRARATERYLRTCHEVFAVTTMEHAVLDKAILDIIKRNGRHRPLRIICTNSDDISIRLTERSDPEVSLQVRTWRQQIEALQKQAKRSEAQRRHGLPGALEEEVRFRDMLEEMEFGLKKFLVERRNSQVATELINKYAEEVHMDDFNVFCVSAQDYWKQRYEEQTLAERRLELSGIVNLRRYCYSIPAEAQFEAATAFVENDVPALLGSLRQWAVGGADEVSKEKVEEIRQVMKNLEEVAIQKLVLPSAQIHLARTTLDHEFASAIVLPIRQHRSEWRNAALEASKEWTKWDAKDYLSFCRHHGTHLTKATGPRTWNEELTAPMRLQLQSNWGFFQESIEGNQKELIDSIDQVFDEICAPLTAHLLSAPTSMQTLLSTLALRRRCITYTIKSSFTDLLEASLNIESEALYGHLSSYINTLMAPAYHAACSLPSRSPGSTPPPSPKPSPTLIDQQRKDALTTHIASSRLFPKLSTMIEKAHRAVVHAAFDKMVEGLTREVDALIRDLGMVGRDENDGTEAARYAEFAGTLRARCTAAERSVREAKAVLGEVRALYVVGAEEFGGASVAK